MTVLWLIRHGQTEWNSEGRWQGQANIPLDETGRQQARALGEDLRGQDFDAVFSSDLQRAYDTAAAFAEVSGNKILVDSDLREICIGEWEGLRIEEILKRFPDEWQAYHQDANWRSPPGGETLLDLARRLSHVVNNIFGKYRDGQVALVAHKVAIACIISLATEQRLSSVWDMEIEPATPIIIEIDRELVLPVK